MKISSHQESTIDYPGKMGQILFVSGCNFKCGFCHNPELVDGKINEINLEALLKNISAKTKAGWYQGITISGGEPTIYHDLPEFIRQLKDMNLCVKLDTNGSNPEMLRRLLKEGTVDYVAMDIKSAPNKYRTIAGPNVNVDNIFRSIETVKLFPEYEFRTTVLPEFNSQDIEDIGKLVSNYKESERGNMKKVRLYTLQQFNPKKTLDPSYMFRVPKSKEEIERFGKAMEKYAEVVRVLV